MHMAHYAKTETKAYKKNLLLLKRKSPLIRKNKRHPTRWWNENPFWKVRRINMDSHWSLKKDWWENRFLWRLIFILEIIMIFIYFIWLNEIFSIFDFYYIIWLLYISIDLERGKIIEEVWLLNKNKCMI